MIYNLWDKGQNKKNDGGQGQHKKFGGGHVWECLTICAESEAKIWKRSKLNPETKLR